MAKTQGKENGRHRAVFELWYSLGQSYSDTARKVAELYKKNGWSDPPRRSETISAWAAKFRWHDRAAKLDAVAQSKIDAAILREAAARKADMLKRHGQHGRMLQAQAFAFFKKFIETKTSALFTPYQALRALQLGIELERRAEGLPDWYIELSGMSDDELRRQYDALAANPRLEDGDGAAGDEAAADSDDWEAEDKFTAAS